MSSSSASTGFHPVRRDQLRQERVHDTYKLQHKLPEPAACPDCGAFYHAGRWQWGAKPAGAQDVVCPACHRIRDRFPAGFVEVGGSFFAEHKGELEFHYNEAENRLRVHWRR